MCKEDLVLNNLICHKTNQKKKKLGGTRGVMVIIVGNGHGDTSSNPGRDWLLFTLH